jgi:hypothetical protein
VKPIPCWPLVAALFAAGCSDDAFRILPSNDARFGACVLSPTAAEREMEKCLQPEGIRLDTAYRRDHVHGKTTTVLATLRELGAVCKDGRVCDRQGWPLYFYWVPDCGVWRTQEMIDADAVAEAMRLRSLEQQYHIIHMHALVRPC